MLPFRITAVAYVVLVELVDDDAEVPEVHQLNGWYVVTEALSYKLLSTYCPSEDK